MDLTVRTAADRSGRHPTTIRRWIRSGRLRAAKRAGRFVIGAFELDRILEADLLPVPPEWETTLTGEPLPNFVAALRQSRAERSREILSAVKLGDRRLTLYRQFPGWELVSAGLSDLNAGRETIEGLLVVSAAGRLRTVGIAVRGEWNDDVPQRLYELIVEQVGEGQAYGRYNALRRRLASFLHAAQPHRALGS
jgi:helix-turn-helix protein